MQTQYLYSKWDNFIDNVDNHVCWYPVEYREFVKFSERGIKCKKVVLTLNQYSYYYEEIPYGITDLNTIVNMTNYDSFNNYVITIPSSVTNIQYFPTLNYNTTHIVLPTTIKSLSINAFNSTSNLTFLESISFSPTIHEFKFDVPYWVSLIVYTKTDVLKFGLPIPDCVYSLGEKCFSQKQFPIIDIPSSVESIRSQCFYTCSVSSLILPSTLTQIASDCINSNDVLSSVTMNGCKTFNVEIPYFLASLLEKSGTHCTDVILNSMDSLNDQLTIPTNIKSIGERCFAKSKKEIVIPTNVTSLGCKAFESALGLTNLKLPITIQHMGRSSNFDCCDYHDYNSTDCWCMYNNPPANESDKSCSTCDKAFSQKIQISNLDDFDSNTLQLKIIVVGDPSSGKTSSIHQFCDGVFENNYQPTIGVEFSSKFIIVDGRTVELRLWDIAGQDHYAGMSRVYYNGALGALVMCDLTNLTSVEDIYWTNNKKDRIAQSLKDLVATEQFQGMLMVSAKTGFHVAETMQNIAKLIISQFGDVIENQDVDEPTGSVDLLDTKATSGSGCCH
ncbi:hypothetical protein QTN25_003503 [Entamoeba marina]